MKIILVAIAWAMVFARVSTTKDNHRDKIKQLVLETNEAIPGSQNCKLESLSEFLETFHQSSIESGCETINQMSLQVRSTSMTRQAMPCNIDPQEGTHVKGGHTSKIKHSPILSQPLHIPNTLKGKWSKSKFFSGNSAENSLKEAHHENELLCKDNWLEKYDLDYIDEAINRAVQTNDSEKLNWAFCAYMNLLSSVKYSQQVLVKMCDLLTFVYSIDPHLHLNFHRYTISLLSDIFRLDNFSESKLNYISNQLVDLFGRKGEHHRAIGIQRQLYLRFPNSTNIMNKLGFLYLIAKQLVDAKRTFRKVLDSDPTNTYALVNIGLIIYIQNKKKININYDSDDPLKRNLSISLAKTIVENMAAALQNDKLNSSTAKYIYPYSQLLTKVGKYDEFCLLTERAVQAGILKGFFQRSTRFVKNIKSKPLWNVHETGMIEVLYKISKKWKMIAKEAMLLKKYGKFISDHENLGNRKKWHVYYLYEHGKIHKGNCVNARYTCRIFHDLSICPKCLVMFSMMESGTHVFPHIGPTNERLRVHIGLDIPEPYTQVAAASPSKLRVGNEYISWENGKMLIFDDSFDHEVWHYNRYKKSRLVLIFDILHPYVRKSSERQF